MLNQSRYLPDRRDLNRSFPGSERGSLAARVADTFLTEIVEHCEYGIDLHTGAVHRSNTPQIRANLDDPETLELATAFDVPVLINAPVRSGTLREAAAALNTKILLYEAGQALRFDELSIRAGVRGIENVLRKLGMLRSMRKKSNETTPFIANHSSWMRATSSGIVTWLKALGAQVSKGDVLAKIGNPFGDIISTVEASRDGIIVGRQNIPLVQEGDAMFHIAYFSDEEDEDVAEYIRDLADELLLGEVPIYGA
jgi:predicted deacylase